MTRRPVLKIYQIAGTGTRGLAVLETVSLARPRSRRTCGELLVLAYPASICTPPVLLITRCTQFVEVWVTRRARRAAAPMRLPPDRPSTLEPTCRGCRALVPALGSALSSSSHPKPVEGQACTVRDHDRRAADGTALRGDVYLPAGNAPSRI